MGIRSVAVPERESEKGLKAGLFQSSDRFSEGERAARFVCFSAFSSRSISLRRLIMSGRPGRYCRISASTSISNPKNNWR